MTRTFIAQNMKTGEYREYEAQYDFEKPASIPNTFSRLMLKDDAIAVGYIPG